MREIAPRIVFVLVIFIAIILIFTHASVTSADSSPNKPFGITIGLGDVYLSQKVSNNLYILAINKNGSNIVYLARIEATIPPRLEKLLSIPIPSEACCITVDNRKNPTSIAIAYANNVLIYDLVTGRQVQFALQGKPLELYPNGVRSFLILTDKALFNIRDNGDKWFEERIMVGNLLPEKREGRKVFDAIPVYENGFNYSYFSVINEAAAYTAKAKLILLWSNGSLIKSGQIIATIEKKAITTPISTITNGSATLPLVPGSYNITLYIKQGNTCFKGPTREVKVSQNTIIQLGTFIVSNRSITECPEPLEARYLAVLGAGFPPREKTIPQSSSTLLGNIKLLLSYIYNNYLYVWITGSNSHLFTQDNFVAVLVYKWDNLQPLTSLWRFYDGVKANNIALSKDYKVVAFASSSGIYIALRANNTYYLAWSLPTQHPIESIDIVKYHNAYLLLAVSMGGYVEIASIQYSQAPLLYTIAPDNTPWVQLSNANGGYFGLNKALYAVFTSSKGVTILTNIDKLIDNKIIINNIYDYIVGYTTITAYNPDGKVVKNYVVRANLTYNNMTLLSTVTRTSNGTAKIPCISYGVTRILIEPLNKNLYKPVIVTINCSKVGIRYDDVNVTLPYVYHKLVIHLIDSYSGKAPLQQLNITIIDIQHNRSISVQYPAKAKSITIGRLLPSNYSIKIIDPRGVLYVNKEVRVNLISDKELFISIDRKPAITIIRLIPVISPAARNIKVTDKLNVTVYSDNGTVLFNYVVSAPTRKPLVLSFATLYRGPAVVKIIDVPPEGRGKFYRDVTKQIYISIESASSTYSLTLSQIEHRVLVKIIIPGNKVVQTVLKVYPINSSKAITIINSTTPSYELFLPIGYYCFHAIPLAKYLGFMLYKPATTCTLVKGTGAETIDIRIEKDRNITTIIFVDPLSKGGKLIDNITIVLDGKEIASIIRGKTAKVKLPILINGSKIVIESQHGVYKRVEKTIKPQKKIIVLRLIRVPFKYSLTVLSTRGNTLSGAVASIDGVDNVLHLRYTTDEKGTISITLPYGTYHICVTCPGYLGKCYTLSIHASASDVVTLKPTIITLLRSYIIPITIVVVGIVLIIAARAYFKRVLERLSEEEF